MKRLKALNAQLDSSSMTDMDSPGRIIRTNAFDWHSLLWCAGTRLAKDRKYQHLQMKTVVPV
jgi:hypothetical protein